MTKSIASAVWTILEKDLVIQHNLRKGIINIRALAKYIIKEHNLNASIDSVISAIRRYKPKKFLTEQKITPREILKDAKITTRNNMASVSIKKVSNINDYLSKLSSFNEPEKEETLRIIKGEKKLKLITDEKNINEILRLFHKDVLEVKEGLSEVSLLIGIEADDTKGVIAQLGVEMLLAGVNIREVIWCVPEVLVYVDKDDLIKVYERLLKISSQ